MMLLLSEDNIRMSDKKTDRIKLAKPFLRQIWQPKTINVSHFRDGDGRPNNEEPLIDKNKEGEPTSPVHQPTLSCQALKHAVSALTRKDDFILEKIGRGFFANVYKATHKVTGEVMVMKINKDSANRSSSLREVQLMNRLSHPNILRFLGVCVHKGQLHALTEYISGGILEVLLANRNEELPWMLRIKLALDIAQGMHYLHSEGVIHRDLTSKNILIKKGENRHYQAVIADFGLAIKIPDPRATEPLPSVGCPWWMAPEVIYGKFYDERADLFSYGIILLEITALIEADPDTMPRTKNFGVDYVKVCEMVEYCPLDFLQLAFRCCQILPDRRPSSGVITVTLEKIYNNLQKDTMTSSEKLRKRSLSEDNILQSSSSFTDVEEEEVLLTPQNVAQAMTKDDPHYCPASANPFANISKFKDGRKVRDFTWQRKCSGVGFSGKCVDMLASFHNSDIWTERKRSQSLPPSPIMLRKAAEQLHLDSLLGRDAFRPDIQPDSQHSFSSEYQDDTEASMVVERRSQYSNNRTRSLGSLDFWTPRSGLGSVNRGKAGKRHLYPNQSEKIESGNQFIAGTKSLCDEDQPGNRFSCIEDCQDKHTLGSEHNTSVCCNTASTVYYNLSNEGGGVTRVISPWSREDSMNISSLSSFISCGDIAEETIEHLPH